MRSERRRGATDAPTLPQHLVGRNVNRMEETTSNAVMRFSRVTQPQPNVDLGNALRSQILISVNNVSRGIIPRNGGGVSNANAANSILSQPAVTVVNPGGLEAIRAVMPALQEILNHYDNNNNNDEEQATETTETENPVQVSSNVTLIETAQQHENHKSSTKRKKAAVQNDDQIVAALGPAVSVRRERL